MAKLTFQGLLRTFVGRTKSGIDKRTGLPVPLLPQNLSGPIQVVLTDADDGEHALGMLPADFAIERIGVIKPADSGTFSLDVPAYGGENELNLVAAGGDASGVTPVAMAIDEMTSFDTDVPLVITTSGLNGTLRLGIWGFPLDNALQVE